jgi:hypothetical protein
LAGERCWGGGKEREAEWMQIVFLIKKFPPIIIRV